MTRAAIRAVLATTLTLGTASFASAQADYPAHPIRIIVPFATGGSADVMSRLVAQKLSERLGQQVIIENRPGGNTITGIDFVAKARPDGYTLAMNTSNIILNESFYKSLPYNLFKDLEPIATTVTGFQSLVISNTLPVSNYKEFVDYIRANPGKLSYATSGSGNINHLLGEYFLKINDLKAVQVPYRGGSDMFPDLIAGRTHFSFLSLTSGISLSGKGQLKLLTTTSTERLKQIPNVPSLKDLNQTDLQAGTWHGFYAPAGTPVAVLDKLNTEINAVLKDPEAVEKIEAQGMSPFPHSRTEFREFLKSENAHWAKVIAATGIKLQ